MANKAFVFGPFEATTEWQEAYRMLLTSPKGLRVYRLIHSSDIQAFEQWRLDRWGSVQRYYDRAKYACVDHRLDYFVEAAVFVSSSRKLEQVWQELDEAFAPIKDCVRDQTRVLILCPEPLWGIHPGKDLQTKATIVHDFYGKQKNVATAVDNFTQTLV